MNPTANGDVPQSNRSDTTSQLARLEGIFSGNLNPSSEMIKFKNNAMNISSSLTSSMASRRQKIKPISEWKNLHTDEVVKDALATSRIIHAIQHQKLRMPIILDDSDEHRAQQYAYEYFSDTAGKRLFQLLCVDEQDYQKLTEHCLEEYGQDPVSFFYHIYTHTCRAGLRKKQYIHLQHLQVKLDTYTVKVSPKPDIMPTVTIHENDQTQEPALPPVHASLMQYLDVLQDQYPHSHYETAYNHQKLRQLLYKYTDDIPSDDLLLPSNSPRALKELAVFSADKPDTKTTLEKAQSEIEVIVPDTLKHLMSSPSFPETINPYGALAISGNAVSRAAAENKGFTYKDGIVVYEPHHHSSKTLSSQQAKKGQYIYGYSPHSNGAIIYQIPQQPRAQSSFLHTVAPLISAFLTISQAAHISQQSQRVLVQPPRYDVAPFTSYIVPSANQYNAPKPFEIVHQLHGNIQTSIQIVPNTHKNSPEQLTFAQAVFSLATLGLPRGIYIHPFLLENVLSTLADTCLSNMDQLVTDLDALLLPLSQNSTCDKQTIEAAIAPVLKTSTATADQNVGEAYIHLLPDNKIRVHVTVFSNSLYRTHRKNKFSTWYQTLKYSSLLPFLASPYMLSFLISKDAHAFEQILTALGLQPLTLSDISQTLLSYEQKEHHASYQTYLALLHSIHVYLNTTSLGSLSKDLESVLHTSVSLQSRIHRHESLRLQSVQNATMQQNNMSPNVSNAVDNTNGKIMEEDTKHKTNANASSRRTVATIPLFSYDKAKKVQVQQTTLKKHTVKSRLTEWSLFGSIFSSMAPEEAMVTSLHPHSRDSGVLRTYQPTPQHYQHTQGSAQSNVEHRELYKEQSMQWIQQFHGQNAPVGLLDNPRKNPTTEEEEENRDLDLVQEKHHASIAQVAYVWKPQYALTGGITESHSSYYQYLYDAAVVEMKELEHSVFHQYLVTSADAFATYKYSEDVFDDPEEDSEVEDVIIKKVRTLCSTQETDQRAALLMGDKLDNSVSISTTGIMDLRIMQRNQVAQLLLSGVSGYLAVAQSIGDFVFHDHNPLRDQPWYDYDDLEKTMQRISANNVKTKSILFASKDRNDDYTCFSEKMYTDSIDTSALLFRQNPEGEADTNTSSVDACIPCSQYMQEHVKETVVHGYTPAATNVLGVSIQTHPAISDISQSELSSMSYLNKTSKIVASTQDTLVTAVGATTLPSKRKPLGKKYGIFSIQDVVSWNLDVRIRVLLDSNTTLTPELLKHIFFLIPKKPMIITHPAACMYTTVDAARQQVTKDPSVLFARRYIAEYALLKQQLQHKETSRNVKRSNLPSHLQLLLSSSQRPSKEYTPLTGPHTPGSLLTFFLCNPVSPWIFAPQSILRVCSCQADLTKDTEQVSAWDTMRPLDVQWRLPSAVRNDTCTCVECPLPEAYSPPLPSRIPGLFYHLDQEARFKLLHFVIQMIYYSTHAKLNEVKRLLQMLPYSKVLVSLTGHPTLENALECPELYCLYDILHILKSITSTFIMNGITDELASQGYFVSWILPRVCCDGTVSSGVGLYPYESVQSLDDEMHLDTKTKTNEQVDDDEKEVLPSESIESTDTKTKDTNNNDLLNSMTTPTGKLNFQVLMTYMSSTNVQFHPTMHKTIPSHTSSHTESVKKGYSAFLLHNTSKNISVAATTEADEEANDWCGTDLTYFIPMKKLSLFHAFTFGYLTENDNYSALVQYINHYELSSFSQLDDFYHQLYITPNPCQKLTASGWIAMLLHQKELRPVHASLVNLLLTSTNLILDDVTIFNAYAKTSYSTIEYHSLLRNFVTGDTRVDLDKYAPALLHTVSKRSRLLALSVGSICAWDKVPLNLVYKPLDCVPFLQIGHQDASLTHKYLHYWTGPAANVDLLQHVRKEDHPTLYHTLFSDSGKQRTARQLLYPLEWIYGEIYTYNGDISISMLLADFLTNTTNHTSLPAEDMLKQGLWLAKLLGESPGVAPLICSLLPSYQQPRHITPTKPVHTPWLQYIPSIPRLSELGFKDHCPLAKHTLRMYLNTGRTMQTLLQCYPRLLLPTQDILLTPELTSAMQQFSDVDPQTIVHIWQTEHGNTVSLDRQVLCLVLNSVSHCFHQQTMISIFSLQSILHVQTKPLNTLLQTCQRMFIFLIYIKHCTHEHKLLESQIPLLSLSISQILMFLTVQCLPHVLHDLLAPMGIDDILLTPTASIEAYALVKVASAFIQEHHTDMLRVFCDEELLEKGVSEFNMICDTDIYSEYPTGRVNQGFFTKFQPTISLKTSDVLYMMVNTTSHLNDTTLQDLAKYTDDLNTCNCSSKCSNDSRLVAKAVSFSLDQLLFDLGAFLRLPAWILPTSLQVLPQEYILDVSSIAKCTFPVCPDSNLALILRDVYNSLIPRYPISSYEYLVYSTSPISTDGMLLQSNCLSVEQVCIFEPITSIQHTQIHLDLIKQQERVLAPILHSNNQEEPLHEESLSSVLYPTASTPAFITSHWVTRAIYHRNQHLVLSTSTNHTKLEDMYEDVWNWEENEEAINTFEQALYNTPYNQTPISILLSTLVTCYQQLQEIYDPITPNEWSSIQEHLIVTSHTECLQCNLHTYKHNEWETYKKHALEAFALYTLLDATMLSSTEVKLNLSLTSYTQLKKLVYIQLQYLQQHHSAMFKTNASIFMPDSPLAQVSHVQASFPSSLLEYTHVLKTQHPDIYQCSLHTNTNKQVYNKHEKRLYLDTSMLNPSSLDGAKEKLSTLTRQQRDLMNTHADYLENHGYSMLKTEKKTVCHHLYSSHAPTLIQKGIMVQPTCSCKKPLPRSLPSVCTQVDVMSLTLKLFNLTVQTILTSHDVHLRTKGFQVRVHPDTDQSVFPAYISSVAPCTLLNSTIDVIAQSSFLKLYNAEQGYICTGSTEIQFAPKHEQISKPADYDTNYSTLLRTTMQCYQKQYFDFPVSSIAKPTHLMNNSKACLCTTCAGITPAIYNKQTVKQHHTYWMEFMTSYAMLTSFCFEQHKGLQGIPVDQNGGQSYRISSYVSTLLPDIPKNTEAYHILQRITRVYYGQTLAQEHLMCHNSHTSDTDHLLNVMYLYYSNGWDTTPLSITDQKVPDERIGCLQTKLDEMENLRNIVKTSDNVFEKNNASIVLMHLGLSSAREHLQDVLESIHFLDPLQRLKMFHKCQSMLSAHMVPPNLEKLFFLDILATSQDHTLQSKMLAQPQIYVHTSQYYELSQVIELLETKAEAYVRGKKKYQKYHNNTNMFISIDDTLYCDMAVCILKLHGNPLIRSFFGLSSDLVHTHDVIPTTKKQAIGMVGLLSKLKLTIDAQITIDQNRFTIEEHCLLMTFIAQCDQQLDVNNEDKQKLTESLSTFDKTLFSIAADKALSTILYTKIDATDLH